MSNRDFDLLKLLRQRHHNVTGGNPLIEPLEGPTIFSQAADEIERLRVERDEARRMCCERAAMDESGYVKHGTMLHFAESRGWDCFKEDGK